MNDHRKINIIIYAFLVIVIIACSLYWKPREASFEEPVYNGSLWRGMIPVEYLSYRALEGELSFEEISTPREFIVGIDQTETRMVNSTAYTITAHDTGSTYYLVTSEHRPITDKRYSDILNASTVYIQGNFFNYLAPDGQVLKMIEHIEVTVEPIIDLVEASRAVIIDVVGERYFNGYFSSPVLWRDTWEPGRMYTVEYVYRCEAGRREQPYRTVSLVFNSDRRLVDQAGIPDKGSLKPFSISKQKAVEIARDHGFPGQGEPSVHTATITHPSEWSSLADNITLQTYYDPRTCAEPINLTHYLLYVDLETSPKHSNPEVHKYAVVDANSGVLYLMSESKMGSVETWGPMDMFDPETALNHGIPGCVNVEYKTEPPKITVVSPGKEVRYEVVLELIPYRDNFTETIIVLDTGRGGSGGIGGVMFRDHVHYENLTCFFLRKDHPVKVNMVYSVPEERDYGFSVQSEELLGQGVNAVIPIKTGRGGSYYRNSLRDLRVDALLGMSQVVDRMPWEDKDPGVSFNKYWGVASKLDSVMRTGKMPSLNEIFVMHYPDWRNGTAYVALTDVSEEATEPILGLFSEGLRENIRFIHAPAPLPILREWIRYLESMGEELADSGVKWTSVSIYFDGRILVGLEEINTDTVEAFNKVLWRVPPGIFVLHEAGPLIDLTVEPMVTSVEGMLSLKDDPDHDWESEPVGPKIKSLDVMDPENGLSIETYILADPEGRYFRLHPFKESVVEPARVRGNIWDYHAPKPVEVTGVLISHTGLNNQTVKVLCVHDVEYSDMGEWVTGVLSLKEQETGVFTFYNRTFGGDFTFLTLKTGEEEIVLASHEGYVYDVPICGTGQPIAQCSLNQTATVRGLRTSVIDSQGTAIPVFMVFEVGK